MKLLSQRAGSLYRDKSGYDCFVPKSLFEFELEIDEELLYLLDQASSNLGKLNGLCKNLPDKDLFISMYVEKEALVSSQIEGTQASLSDVLQYQKLDSARRKETEEVVNYVYALNYGNKLLDKLPISGRFLKEIHKELLRDVRGQEKNPGEMRRSQNWIGPQGCTLSNASFVPPSIDKMMESFSDLEKYINDDIMLAPLIKISLIHYQFETIHPFLDGNGRLGRLLIPLWLKENGILDEPLLYLSLYFKKNRFEYYGLLMDVRFKGEYERWIKFFLRGVIEMSKNSVETIDKIMVLMNEVNDVLKNLGLKNTSNISAAMNYIYKHPYFDSTDLRNYLSVSKPTVSVILKTLLDKDIIEMQEEKKRYVNYKFTKYISILEEGISD